MLKERTPVPIDIVLDALVESNLDLIKRVEKLERINKRSKFVSTLILIGAAGYITYKVINTAKEY